MKKSVSRTLAMALAACMAAGTLAACGSSGSSAVASSAAESTADSTAASTESGTPDYSNEDPINIRIYLSDNATLPYKEDWLTFTEVQKRWQRSTWTLRPFLLRTTLPRFLWH